MKIKIYHISKGLESKFNLFSPFWFYSSKFESWIVIRVCGIYFWIYPKFHDISFRRKSK